MGKLKLLILILLFVSCSQSPKESVIQQQNLSSVSIPIDFDEEIRQGIKLSELVENIEFVSLEVTDDCLLRGVDHAEVTDEYIYVVDKPDHRSPCVYQFDRKGHFLRPADSGVRKPALPGADLLHHSLKYPGKCHARGRKAAGGKTSDQSEYFRKIRSSADAGKKSHRCTAGFLR